MTIAGTFWCARTAILLAPFCWRFCSLAWEYQLSFLEMHSRGFEPSEMLKALPLDLSVGAAV